MESSQTKPGRGSQNNKETIEQILPNKFYPYPQVIHYLFNGYLRLVSWLPLPANHAVGVAIGWLFWVLPTRARDTTLINLQLCYPDLPAEERQRLAKESLFETGKSITELGWFWFRPSDDLTPITTIIDPLNLLTGESGSAESESAESSDDTPGSKKPGQDKGVLFITPHFGSWELIPLVLADIDKPVFLYKKPRLAGLDATIRTGRTRFGAELVPVSAGGLKTLLRSLKNARAIGVLPDQEPEKNSGVFAEFFGTPAYTMTLIANLSRRTDCKIVCLVVKRKPRGRGYEVHLVPVTADVSHTDPQKAAKALNETVEQCISIAPEQYIWNYRRFRMQTDGTRRPYRIPR